MSTIVYIIAGVIAVAVVAIGWRDIARFRFRRVRAIAGVCYSESIRRRVLWITPLAIVGVIAISLLTRPYDEQDAVRQSIKYCLFATALIVVVAALILACTNLPKEIENRVIFTIVTKPTTRLEIVLGKVLGFAMVSGLILLIMGAFTFVYLEARTWSMTRDIRALLASPGMDAGNRRQLQRYADSGLLSTKAIQWPKDLQVYGRTSTEDGTRWIVGQQTFFLAPFVLTQNDVRQFEQKVNERSGLFLIITVKVAERKLLPDEARELKAGNFPQEGEVFGPAVSTTQPVRYAPRVGVIAFSAASHQAIGTKDLPTSAFYMPVPDRNWTPGAARTFAIPLSGSTLKEFVDAGAFNVEVSGATLGYDLGAGPTPISLVVVDRTTGAPVMSIPNSTTSATEPPQQTALSTEPVVTPPGVRFLSRFGRVGMQVIGRDPEEGEGSVAVYSFAGASGAEARNGKVLLQTKVSVDRGGDLDADRFKTSLASLQVRNRKTGFLSEPVVFEPTTNRLVDVEVQAQAVEGGDFDVSVRGVTPGQYLGFHGLMASTPSIALVTAEQSFGINLFKSLLILWMLSILVVAISIFCSTFLSWPIAVVLTVMLLLGRWGVNELGDALDPGSSRIIMKDLFGIRDPNKSETVNNVYDALATTLKNGAKVLPNVARFPVMEDLDRGVSIPLSKILAALRELVIFGVPLVLLTYVILRNKEVAP